MRTNRQHSSAYPRAYVQYLAEYHGSRDFFECHEIMEEYWKQQKGTRHETCWLVLIRLSVALYHARRGNRGGALKLMGKAAQEIEPERMDELGLDGEELARRIGETLARWREEEPIRYADLDLPIADAALEAAARKLCEREGWRWGMGGLEAGEEVIDRHLRRDRTDVVAARAEAARRKAADRRT